MQEFDFIITGSTGFLGEIIKKALLPDYSLFTINRTSPSDCVCDLAKEVPVLKPDLRAHHVIHLAGKAHLVPKNNYQADEFFQTNYRGTIRLTQALEQLEQVPERFIFISTVAVYGKDVGNLIDESSPLAGSTPYAKSKIQSEEFLNKWCAHHNVTLTILRLPLLVGPNPPGNLGAIIRWIKRGLYIGIGKGGAARSMVLAEDVARFIPQVSKIGGTYNLTDGHHPTVFEIENAVSRAVKKRILVRLPDWFIRVVARVGDLLGEPFQINSLRYKKLTSSLTFSDEKAKHCGWNPRAVIDNLKIEME